MVEIRSSVWSNTAKRINRSCLSYRRYQPACSGATIPFATSMTHVAARATRKTGKTPQVHQSCRRAVPITPLTVKVGRFRACAGSRSQSRGRSGPRRRAATLPTTPPGTSSTSRTWSGHNTQSCTTCESRPERRGTSPKASAPSTPTSSLYRDGFIDGYVDYLDRGGNGSLPAVPPAKYTRHKKYFTENGQCLAKEYFLGFKHGQEVAIATGRRQFLTVPVLLPQPQPVPPAFNVQPAGETAAPPMMQPPKPLPTPPPLAERPERSAGRGRSSSTGNRLGSRPARLCGRFPKLHRRPILTRPRSRSRSRRRWAKVHRLRSSTRRHCRRPRRNRNAGRSRPRHCPCRYSPARLARVLGAIFRRSRRCNRRSRHPSCPAPVPVPELNTPRVLPPNHTVRPPLPPNHPQPRQ